LAIFFLSEFNKAEFQQKQYMAEPSERTVHTNSSMVVKQDIEEQLPNRKI
jgi:hypothetical protein